MEMTDEQIIACYWRREERAIEETDRKYGAYCLALAQNILQNREDAEECRSDTWLKAWQAIPPKRPGKLGAFLAKITRNLALNRCRARMAEKRGGGETALILEELAECLSDPQGVESECLAKELGERVNQFVRALPDRERGIFLRRYFYAEPVGRVAGRYGITAHHAAVLLSRTRKKLREYLDREEFL